MKLRLIITAILITPLIGLSQQKDTLINKLDSLSKKQDSAGGQINNISLNAYDEDTKITFNAYFALLGSDLKQEFTKPFHMTRKNWGNFAEMLAVGGALSFADKPIQRNAAPLITKYQGLGKVSSFITKFGGPYEAFALGTFGAYGIIFKSQKMKTTTLLATQAYLTGAALESVMKYLSGRTRPVYYEGTGQEPRPRFFGPFSKTSKTVNGKKLYSSFPSGHTTVAFAAATVFALEYSNQPWTPILAYSAATMIGLSRITENKHWATDVFAGALIGFMAGKNVVNNYHRYAKLKAPGKRNNKPVSFNLQYFNGHITPGLTYRF